VKDILKECIVIATEISGDIILAKNRDRTYSPTLQIVREVVDGKELVYLLDVETDWSEGMNSDGVGIVNSTLNVGFDENERVIVRKKGSKSKDGVRIRTALNSKTSEEGTKSIIKNMVIGHTFVASPESTWVVEISKGEKPKAKKMINSELVVRTNHGDLIPNAGYVEGENYKSTRIRKISAEKILANVDDYNKIASRLRTDLYKTNSMLNMTRKTDYIYTTSQMVMNLNKRIFILYLLDENIDEFKGILNKCPSDHKNQIDIYVFNVKRIKK